MITNTGITIYNLIPDESSEAERYKRTYVSACFWRNVKAKETKKYGAELASSVSVMIFKDMLLGYVSPESFTGDGWTVDGENKTYICKGNCPVEVQQSINEVIDSYRETYHAWSSLEALFGSDGLHHLEIEGR